MFQALLTSTLSRLSTTALALGVVSLVAIPVKAQTVLLSGYKTTGADLAGATVTASFLDGSQQFLTWSKQPKLGNEAGGIITEAWRLTQQGNSFQSPWQLSVGPSLTLTSLMIDLVGGNAVFDIEPDSRSAINTTGSQQGSAFRVKNKATNTAPLPTYEYSSPVDISQGDLFTTLTLQWENGFTNNRLEFIADTDSGTIENPVTVSPEPVALVREAPTPELLTDEPPASPIAQSMVAPETQETTSVPEPGMLLGLVAIAGLSRKIKTHW